MGATLAFAAMKAVWDLSFFIFLSHVGDDSISIIACVRKMMQLCIFHLPKILGLDASLEF